MEANGKLAEIKRRYKQGETAWHLNDIALLLAYCGDLERQVETADGTIVGWLRTNKQLTEQPREAEAEREQRR